MKLLGKIAALFRKEKLDAEMSEEMRLHLERRAEENIAAGMAPEEARCAALRKFGGVEQTKERARDQRGWRWLEQSLQDVRHALRQLARSPGFTAVVVLILALGVGANTAIFSLVDDVLLRSLPVKSPGELVLFDWVPGAKGAAPLSAMGDATSGTDPASGRSVHQVFAWPTFERLRDGRPLVADLFAVAGLPGLSVMIDGQAEVVNFGQIISGNYFQALGVPAIRGRTIALEDDKPDAAPVAVISFHYWQTRFAGDPAIVGKTIFVNHAPLTIIGVTPPGFAGTMLNDGTVEITLPLALAARVHPSGAAVTSPKFWWLRIMGRLKPGVVAAQAGASLQGVFQANARDGLTLPDDVPQLRALPGGRGRTEGERRQSTGPLTILTGMGALLLLAACANVANLLLARGSARRREIAVRLALGASRGRLIWQLLVENLPLALLGGAGGLLFANWGLDWLAAMLPPGDREAVALRLDWHVLGFAVVVALLTGTVFGLVPALRATRLDLTAEFQGGIRTLGQGARSRLSRMLMVVQVALALVLLVGAGLFVRTLRNLQAVDAGFDRAHLLLFSIDLDSAGYQRVQFSRLDVRIAERIGAQPGVSAVTFSGSPILSGSDGPYANLSLPGSASRPGGDEAAVFNQVGEDFFATFKIPIVAGRTLDRHDTPSAPKVAVVNEALARKYFGEAPAVGRHILLNGDKEIVGVARDIKQIDLRQPTQPTAYVPFAQNPTGRVHFAVRAAADPAAIVGGIRRAVSEVDRNLPLGNVRTQDEQVEWTFTLERVFASLTSLFGVLVLVLASVGLYGLVSFMVLRRTSEIGLRMALGALPRWVLWMVLRDSLTLICAGAFIGLIVAAIATRWIGSMLYGLSPLDVSTYFAATLILVVVAALACLIPAWHAARVDSAVALRSE